MEILSFRIASFGLRTQMCWGKMDPADLQPVRVLGGNEITAPNNLLSSQETLGRIMMVKMYPLSVETLVLNLHNIGIDNILLWRKRNEIFLLSAVFNKLVL